MKYKVVEVTVANHAITVDLDPVPISKNAKQEIVWVGNADFAVSFKPPECPFDKANFPSSGRAAVSGEAKVPPRTQPFKYTITSPGATPLDPGVRVDP